MNMRIRRHFDEIEVRLIESPAILSYEIGQSQHSIHTSHRQLHGADPIQFAEASLLARVAFISSARTGLRRVAFRINPLKNS